MTSLIISSWNIQALNTSASGSKINSPDFKQTLHETDIQILLETWTQAKDEPSVPTGYREFSVPAQKDKNISLQFVFTAHARDWERTGGACWLIRG